MASSALQPARADRRQLAVIGAVALVVTFVLLALWYALFRVEYAPAFTRLKPEDAAVIVDQLKRSKVSYELADGGTVIKVPKDQVDATRLTVLSGDVPLKGTVGFELFNKSDLGLTEFAQKINYQRALQGEIARTLMSLANVEHARVHITLPQESVFKDNVRPAKASVTLEPKPARVIDSAAIVGAQRLVASAVEGLEPGNVVVLDQNGRQMSGDALSGTLVPIAGTSEAERGYAERVRATVAPLVDDPGLRVEVSAPGAPPGWDPASGAAGERSFPIGTRILLSHSPGPQLSKALEDRLRQGLGLTRNPGDTVQIQGEEATSANSVAAPIGSARGVAPAPVALNGGLDDTLWWKVACAMLVVVFAGILLARLRPRRLTDADRAEFAARLRELLAQREGPDHV